MERLQLKIRSLIKDSILKVEVKPNSKITEVLKADDEGIRIALAAPADKDKANKELIRFLSKLLKRKVLIKRGMKSRSKVLQIF